MIVGSGISPAKPVVTTDGGNDSDAQAFIDRGITDPTEQGAINTLVVDLKGYSLWAKCHQILPFVFNDATKNSWDLSSNQDATFSGGMTHSGRYITGNGTNAYVNTNINDNTTTSLNSVGVSYYCGSSGTRTMYHGADNGVTSTFMNNPRNTTGNHRFWVHDAGPSFQGSNASTQGFYTFTREDSSDKKMYKGGSLFDTISATSVSKLDLDLYFMAYNNAGSPSLYDNRDYNCYVLHEGLDATESSNLDSAFSTFRTTLGL